MNFHPIDLDSWARKPYYEHYLNRVRCTYSMTADLDITLLQSERTSRGIRLYPALLYLIAKVVNRHSEFRTCLDAEGRLGVWEQMSPGFTIFHEDDQTFSSIWTPFHEEFGPFYEGCLRQMEAFRKAKGLFPDPAEPPNTFPISSIPWVSFTGFNLNIYNEGAYLLPIFTVGQFRRQEGRIRLPVSVQFHHAVCDGYHAGVCFQELQALADECGSWLAGPSSP
ncbi:type A chloramphenicol O-acetyltransferase [Paenibacillus sp. CC-CFT747]|nr:type A chloramphenicol O-acetyltransferase [Paenibacillus sp. CC-CFT747]